MKFIRNNRGRFTKKNKNKNKNSKAKKVLRNTRGRFAKKMRGGVNCKEACAKYTGANWEDCYDTCQQSQD